MKTFTASVALVALVCLIPSALAQNDAFEDCATTTFKMNNNKVFIGADVFKYVKLTTGQGTLDCMQLCRANDECWSYNFDKSRKFCYLISEDGSSIKSKRRQLWSAGYKVCVDHSDTSSWDNEPTDSATLAPTFTAAEVSVPGDSSNDIAGVATFVWASAKGTATLNGASIPKYRVLCGEDNTDWTCDGIIGQGFWTSGTPTSGVTFTTTKQTDIETFWNFGTMKCYVETYINGIKTACSDAITLNVDPMVGPLTWSAPSNNTVEMTSSLPIRSELTYVVGCTLNITQSCLEAFTDTDTILSSDLVGASTTETTVNILMSDTVNPGFNACYLYVKNAETDPSIIQECSDVAYLNVPGPALIVVIP